MVHDCMHACLRPGLVEKALKICPLFADVQVDIVSAIPVLWERDLIVEDFVALITTEENQGDRLHRL